MVGIWCNLFFIFFLEKKKRWLTIEREGDKHGDDFGRSHLIEQRLSGSEAHYLEMANVG